MINLQKLKKRTQIIQSIRSFFDENGFLEVETPTLVFSPGMEPHIKPFFLREKQCFLQTSPEFAMKRILAHGVPKLYQICKSYRDEPMSSTHHPEFTMLEWYRSPGNFKDIMKDSEDLFLKICMTLNDGATSFETRLYGKQQLKTPWHRYTVNEAFQTFLKIDLRNLLKTEELKKFCKSKSWLTNESNDLLWDDLFFLAMMNGIEPELKKLGAPVILSHYPKSQAALSNLEKDDQGVEWAKRFEIYAAGLELGNAFDELLDAQIQRERFENDMELRKKLYKDRYPISPIDEDFLAALEQIQKNQKTAGGIAVGVDRLVMYFLGTDSIHDVLWQEASVVQKI